MKLYQPVPFKEIEVETQRTDCEERYQAIKKNYGSFAGVSMIDICCANGFFGFRFLQDGGVRARGIEKDIKNRDFINELTERKDLPFLCTEYLPGDAFDIGIYLDTHYYGTTEKDGYLEFLQKNIRHASFVSSCERDDEFRELLKTKFRRVEPIYKGFQERTIFKCA